MMTRTGSFMMVTMNIDNAGPKAVSAQPVNSSNVIANWRHGNVTAASKLSKNVNTEQYTYTFFDKTEQ